MVQSIAGQNYLYIDVPLAHIDEMIVQERIPTQNPSLYSDTHIVMTISFDLSDASQLKINGRRHAVSTIQLHFEHEEDANELRSRIELHKNKTSQGRISVSQVLDVSGEGAFMLPDTTVGSEEPQELNCISPSSCLNPQPTDEDVLEQIQEKKTSAFAAANRESVAVADHKEEALPTKGSTENPDPQLLKLDPTNSNLTPAISPRRSPRFQQSLINGSNAAILLIDRIVHTHTKDAGAYPDATPIPVEPPQSLKTQPSPRVPIAVNEEDVADEPKANALSTNVEANPLPDNPARSIRRSPRLALQSNRNQSMVKTIDLPAEKLLSGTAKSILPRDAIQGVRALREKYHSIRSTRSATGISKKTSGHSEEVQLLPTKKVAGGRVAKNCSAKAKKGNLKDVGSTFSEDPNVWEIPNDESENLHTRKKETQRTSRPQHTKAKSKASRSKQAARPDKKTKGNQKKAVRSDPLQRRSCDEYEPSQNIGQTSGSTDIQGSRRVLRSSKRNAESLHTAPTSAQELFRRPTIRKGGPSSSKVKANQKVARDPAVTSQIETKSHATVGKHIYNDSEGAASGLASSAVRDRDNTRGSSPGWAHHVKDQLTNLGTQKVVELTERVSPRQGDRCGDIDRVTGVFIPTSSNISEVPQESAILVTGDKVSTRVEAQMPRESSGSPSRLLNLSNEPCFDLPALAKPYTPAASVSLVSKAKDQGRDGELPTDIQDCGSQLEKDVANAFHHSTSPISHYQTPGTDNHESLDHRAEPNQEHFDNAMVFSHLEVREIPTNEEWLPLAPTDTMAETIDRSNASGVMRRELSVASNANFHELLGRDAFASKVATVLHDTGSDSHAKTSEFSRETRHPLKSPAKHFQIKESARSRFEGNPAASCEHLSKDLVTENLTVEKIVESINRVTPTIMRAIKIQAEAATISAPVSDEDARCSTDGALRSQKPVITDLSLGRKESSSLSDETPTGHGNEKGDVKLFNAKRKADREAEGDTKRHRGSAPNKAVYSTPKRKLLVGVPNGALTPSPLADDRDDCKPMIINFTNDGPHNQGKRAVPKDSSGLQTRHPNHLVISTSSTASKRKLLGESAPQRQENLQEDGRKRPKYHHFFPLAGQGQPMNLVELPSPNHFQHSRPNSSQCTRIALDGSPIAIKQFSPDDHTLKVVASSISDLSSSEKDEFSPISFTESNHPVLREESYFNTVVQLPDLLDERIDTQHSRRGKSGTGKLIPDIPTAPSRTLSNSSAYVLQPGGGFINLQTQDVLYETEKLDPLQESEENELTAEVPKLPKTNSFLERLRMSVAFARKSVNEGNNAKQNPTMGQDPNETLMSKEERRPRRAARSPGSPSSSHSSSTAATRSRSRLPYYSDGPGDSPRTLGRRQWRAALKPHQAETRRILEEMSDVRDRSSSRIPD